jgi:hypothetical protein
MSFYNLSQQQRNELIRKIYSELKSDINNFLKYASDADTYIRKYCYLKLYDLYSESNLKAKAEIISYLSSTLNHQNEKVRQTVINALGEIGKVNAEDILHLFENALNDDAHEVRNAIIGSLKKMGEVNPKPMISFAKKYIHNSNPEIRRIAIHGIELRGRTHPEDVLPVLKECQNEKVAKIRNMVVHVVGQISYKSGCLEKVIEELKTWENKELVHECLDEIIETHKSYEKFSQKTLAEAKEYITLHMT